MRPTIEYAEGGAERQDSVTNDLRQMNEPLGARARVASTGPTVAEYFRDAEEAMCKNTVIYCRSVENLVIHDTRNITQMDEMRSPW